MDGRLWSGSTGNDDGIGNGACNVSESALVGECSVVPIPGSSDTGESKVCRSPTSVCQADVTFSSDNLSHREQTEPMPQQYSDLRV